jgi:hypothetical protein
LIAIWRGLRSEAKQEAPRSISNLAFWSLSKRPYSAAIRQRGVSW